MQWQLSPSVIAEAGTALVILILAVCFPWRDISRRARLIGSMLLIIAALWILTHSLEIGIPAASYKASLMGLQLIWGLLALTLWLNYIIHYTATEKWQTGRIYTMFGIVPLLAILAMVTNNIYGLMWTDPGLNINNPYLPLEPAYGTVYWVCMAYMGVLIASGSYLVINKVFRQNNFRGWEPWILILAVVIPLLVAFLEVMGFNQSANLTVGLTPFFSGIGSIILVWSLPRFHLQKVIPIARDTVFAQIGDGVVVLNMQNRVVDLNPAAERLAGYTSSEAIGMPVEQIWTNWPSRLVLPEPAPTVFEELTLAHAGEQRTYSLHSYTITDHKNRPLNEVILLIDTTERKKAADEIKHSQEFLQTIFNSTNDSSCIIDVRNFTIAGANHAFLQEQGMKEEQVLGKTCYQLTHHSTEPCRPPDDTCPLKVTVANGKPASVVHTHYIHDNEKRFIEVSTSPIMDAGGNIVQVVHISRDITESKRAEEELNQSHVQLERAFEAIIKTISVTVEMRDPYTAGHQQRVAQLAGSIAKEIGLPGGLANEIFTAATIHDIGKIQVPSEIISKPGKLGELEFSLLKMHSQVGYDILQNADFPYPLSRWVLEHHERINGSGYPSGLTGGQISLEAKILAVADVVEAMASHRPYRPALGLDKALEEILQNRGILYDADVVDACLKLFKEKGFRFE